MTSTISPTDCISLFNKALLFTLRHNIFEWIWLKHWKPSRLSHRHPLDNQKNQNFKIFLQGNYFCLFKNIAMLTINQQPTYILINYHFNHKCIFQYITISAEKLRNILSIFELSLLHLTLKCVDRISLTELIVCSEV